MNKYKYKNMMFFDADTGGGEGGGESTGGSGGLSHGEAAFEPITKSTTGDRPLPGQKPDVTTPSPGPDGAETDATPASSAFDASKFAKEFGDTLGTTLKPILERQTAEPKQKMTPEEAAKYLNVWQPDDAWYAKYDNLETRAQAMHEMRDGLVNQADRMNQLRMQEAMDQLREEFAPGLKSAAETVEQQRESRLHTQYPMLKNDALKPLINAIAQDFINQKKSFPNEGELFKALASGVEAVLKVNNPDFKLETAATNGNGSNQPADRAGRQLPVTSPGGGGGTGRREGGNKEPVKRGLAVFAK